MKKWRLINVIGLASSCNKNTKHTVSFSRQTYMRTHLFYYRYPLRSSKFLLDNSWFNYVSIQKKSCPKKFVHQTIFVWHYIRLFIVDYTYKRIIGLVDCMSLIESICFVLQYLYRFLILAFCVCLHDMIVWCHVYLCISCLCHRLLLFLMCEYWDDSALGAWVLLKRNELLLFSSMYIVYFFVF